MNSRRFDVTEDGTGWAVVDQDGAVVAHATELVAYHLAKLLRVLALTDEQLAALLDDPRLLRTIRLRHPGVCWRCGRPLRAGSPARWNVATRGTRHLRRCPASAAARERPARPRPHPRAQKAAA